MRSTSLIMIASAVFGSSLAIAQSALTPDADKHKLHALSKFGERFLAADTDGDGALSREEAEAAGMSKVSEHFDRLDLDGDGKLTREELRKHFRPRPTT